MTDTPNASGPQYETMYGWEICDEVQRGLDRNSRLTSETEFISKAHYDALSEKCQRLEGELAELRIFKEQWDSKDGNSPGYNLEKARNYGRQAFEYKTKSEKLEARVRELEGYETGWKNQVEFIKNIQAERDQLKAELERDKSKYQQYAMALRDASEEREKADNNYAILLKEKNELQSRLADSRIYAQNLADKLAAAGAEIENYNLKEKYGMENMKSANEKLALAEAELKEAYALIEHFRMRDFEVLKKQNAELLAALLDARRAMELSINIPMNWPETHEYKQVMKAIEAWRDGLPDRGDGK